VIGQNLVSIILVFFIASRCAIISRSSEAASGNTFAASITRTENSAEIARAMQHADNLDSIRQRQIKNHIVAKGKASEVLAQFFACAADVRIARHAIENLVKPVEKRVGPCLAVLGDKIPDVRKIDRSERPYENARIDYARSPPARSARL